MSNLVPFQDMQSMSAAIAKSGLFGMKTPDQALALMLVAQAEGMHPATITQDYDIIQGKACRKTHSVLARFQQAGGKVEWHQMTDQVAEATFSHPSGGSVKMMWTFEQAKKAGLTNKDNWRNYPRAMLRARLIAEAIRSVYPAAIGGMLLSEEAQDLPPMPRSNEVKQVNTETGEIEMVDDGYQAFEDQWLTGAREASLQGWEALKGFMAALPAGPLRDKFSVAHSKSLKQAAKQAEAVTDVEVVQ